MQGCEAIDERAMSAGALRGGIPAAGEGNGGGPRVFDEAALTQHFAALTASLSGSFAGYPKDYQRVDQKTRPVIEQLGAFSGRHVVEIGSNFGMYSLLMSGIARHVTALEPNGSIHRTSLHWKAFFEDRGFAFPNVDFVNEGAMHATGVDYDALLMTLVLYHLNNDEIDRLIEDARGKCEVAIVQCRPGRGLARDRGSFGGYLSQTDRFDGLYDIAGNIRFLHALGLKNVSVSVSSELHWNEVFPVLVGRR
jgi:hypothetical protein